MSSTNHVMEPIAGVEAPIKGRLGERLLSAGKLNERDLQNALQAQQELGGYLGQVLVQLGVVAETDVAQALSEQLHLRWLRAEEFPDLLPEVPGLLPGFLDSQCVCPVSLQDGVLEVAMSVPQDPFISKALRLATGLQIKPVLALEADIRKALSEAVQEPEGEEGQDWESDASGGDFVEHLKDLASEAPVIRLVTGIISRAIELHASDIHLEPFEAGLQVRYRMDGVIHAAELVPPRLSAAVGSRVKLLPNAACRRTAASRPAPRAVNWTCVSPPRPRCMARASSCGYWTVPACACAWRPWALRPTRWGASTSCWPSRTASCWSQAPRARARPPRCMRPCPRSTRSPTRSSPSRTRSNTSSTASTRSRSIRRST
jgi:hypothetical protein